MEKTAKPLEHSYNNSRLIENCTFVKTILMLIVVLYHSIVFFGGMGWFSAIEPSTIIVPIKYFAKWLNSFHVYGFVLTSGYLYSYLRMEKGKYLKYGPFLMNKAKRLLVPYAFIALVWVIPVGQVFFHNSAMNIVQDYLLGTGPSQLWFLLMLFGVFAMSWRFTNIIHNSVCSSILISCCFLAIGLIGSHFVQNYFMVWTACLYLPFFIFGMKLRDMHERGILLVLKTPFIILLALADILLFVVQQHIVGKNHALFTIINIPVELSLHLLGAFVAFYALQSLAVRIKWKDSKYCL